MDVLFHAACLLIVKKSRTIDQNNCRRRRLTSEGRISYSRDARFLILLFSLVLVVFACFSATTTFRVVRAAEYVGNQNGSSQSPSASASISTLSNSPLNITLTSNEMLRVLSPASANISLVSVVGGEYSLSVSPLNSSKSLVFLPLDQAKNETSHYSMIVNVSSTAGAQNFAFVSAPPLSSGISSPQSSFEKNITGTGNIVLTIDLSVVPQEQTRNSGSSLGWNPLFGFTGFTLGGVSFSATDFLAAIAVAAICFVALGVKYNQKLLYLGLSVLGVVGLIAVGIFLVGAAVAIYLAGFLLVRLYYGKSHKSSPSTGTNVSREL
jgi:hypothetical protein